MGGGGQSRAAPVRLHSSSGRGDCWPSAQPTHCAAMRKGQMRESRAGMLVLVREPCTLEGESAASSLFCYTGAFFYSWLASCPRRKVGSGDLGGGGQNSKKECIFPGGVSSREASPPAPAGTAPTDSCLGAKPLPHGKLPAVPAPVTLATSFFRLCK